MSFQMKSFVENVKPLGLLDAGTPISFKVLYASIKSTKGAAGSEEQKAKPQRPMLKVLLKLTSHSNIKKIEHLFFRPVEGDNTEIAENWDQDLLAFVRSTGYSVKKNGDVPEFVPGMDQTELPGWKELEGFAIVGQTFREYIQKDENTIREFITEDEYKTRLELSAARR